MPPGDHPRGCGAHAINSRFTDDVRGSSPRVRGSLATSARRLCALGIIPAGAGLTHLLDAGGVPCGDHPRGCGAHGCPALPLVQDRGSSPRVRGSHLRLVVRVCLGGIIPAGAGLTRPETRARRRCRDHPRGCGAHQIDCLQPSASSGSSPRVRGSHTIVRICIWIAGIIPAGAGLTYLKSE